MTKPLPNVPPEKRAGWEILWDAAGPARIAELLASPASHVLITGTGGTDGAMRAHAEDWLTKKVQQTRVKEGRAERRANIALAISAGALLVAAVAAWVSYHRAPDQPATVPRPPAPSPAR